MGRSVTAILVVCLLASCGLLLSCSSSSATHVTPNEVPASVALSPSGNVSLELGKFQMFTASATNSTGTTLTQTFTFQSSNPSVVTIASNGNACAGTWDSLSSPVVCTPGSTGTAQITAIGNGGVASPPVTVYVHQHVTSVVIQKAPNQPATLSTACLTRGAPSGPERVIYQASAFAGTIDITAQVGPFTWGQTTITGQPLTSAAVLLTSAGVNAPLNQEVAIANVPGTTSIFASSGGVNSQPLPFTTCPVQSISVNVADTPPSSSSFVVSVGSGLTINATVRDSIGMTLVAVPLTWSSSDPSTVTVSGATSSVYASTGSVATSAPGGAAITASCTPPLCNGGISPSMPIYPTDAISVLVKSAASSGTSSTSTTSTIYVTSKACGLTTQSCTTRIVPITQSGTTAPFAAGTPITLPSTPNSFVFGPASGSPAYLGTDNSAFGTQGLMVLSGASVAQQNGTAGRVLAVSPDSTTVILSDTTDSPSRVNICKNCNGAARSLVSLLLPNATAAAFSVEGTDGSSFYKAYVVSGSSCPGTSSAGCLLVYSQVDAAQFVPLTLPATDAAFIGNGTLGYIAQPGQTSFLPTCGPSAAGSVGNASLAAQLMRPMPDGLSLLALAPPTLQSVTAVLGPLPASPPANIPGCPTPRGFLSVNNNVGPSFNLGVGNFTPTEFFVSPDGLMAYILGQTGTGASAAPLPFIIAFNLTSETTSLISLAGSAKPLNAALSQAGDLLFVGADDDAVHVINTSTGLDTQQVVLTFPQSNLCAGPGNPSTEVSLSAFSISAAAESGVTTTYTFNLNAGSIPRVGQTVVITNMSDSSNNGTFTITAVNPLTSTTGTFAVSNGAGVNASGQNGTGTVPLPCNPDLVVRKP